MRWLFLFVLLMNVLYVSWEVSQLKDDATVPNSSDIIPSIELLSETGQATQNPTQKPAEVTASSSTQSREPGREPDPAVKSPAPESQPVTQQAVVSSPVDSRPGVDRCYTLGPFRELDNLRQFTRAIKSYVTTASFRSREEREQSMFWVFLEPSNSLAEARALGKRLESQNIKDYYVISGGTQDKGVSLGHFKEKDRAYALAERVQGMGFKPLVEPVFRTYTIFWLDYEVPASKVIPQNIFSRHLSKKINRLNRACS